MRHSLFLAALLGWGAFGFAQTSTNRYAVILNDEPVATRYRSAAERESPAALEYRRQVETAQSALRTQLEQKKFTVTGSATTVLNAIFVIAPPSRVAELRAIPGVKDVVPLRRQRRNLNRATQLVNAPAAWNAVGGMQKAGTGIKIAILDTGIDNTHPAMQDSSLTPPAGYPICSGSDCAFTNSKVIVARSYIQMLAAGTDPKNPAADSRPDDYSPRDHDGHGTAVATAAAGNTATGTVTINGMAPKAFVGNYKIYGSPGVNDMSTDDVVIAALDDAVKDKMDIISHSSGSPALTGPLDTGTACGLSAGTPCDPLAAAFENAVKGGVVVVSAAGNDGESGYYYPSFNSIESPGDAPDVISVGASTNSHYFNETVTVTGNPPSNLTGIVATVGDANTFYPGAVTLALVDVTQLGNDGFACAALPTNSLYGSIALIERGNCTYATQVMNAENAGAYGVIIYMNVSGTPVAPSDSNDANLVPFLVIDNATGMALKTYVDKNPNVPVTIDSAGMEVDNSGNENQLAGFSSLGPSTGDSLVKPDLVAPGTSIYTAAQNFDFQGGVYSSTRFAAADGTSFSTPIIAGAAALVKQQHPAYNALQIKSALVNTAAMKVTTDDSSSGSPISVDVQSVGAGLLDAGAAVGANVAVTPTAVSFGIISNFPQTKTIQITNLSSSTVNYTFKNMPGNSSPASATVMFSSPSMNLAAGATSGLSVTISGTFPGPGEYSAFIQIQGGAATVNVPYMLIVPDNSPGNLIELGSDFDGTVGTTQPPETLAVKLVDDFGAPITGATVTYTASSGASVQGVTQTDMYGIATAQAVLGSQPGNYTFTATNSGMSITFNGTARVQPTITQVQNSANGDTNLFGAPGSYITLIGTGLSDFTDRTITPRLPLAIDSASVSFDVPSANLSLPGHVSYVSPTQVNVQVPWELAGQSSAQVKVTISSSPGKVITVPIPAYSPALYESSPGVATAVDANGKLITSSNGAQRGQTIVLYGNGLGPVNNQPASGEPAPTSPLATTTTQPVVMFDNQQAQVSFSGLNPGLAGVYQMNVMVPPGLTPGTHQVTISIGGKTSKASSITVI
jgi:minor extracellular serine protease Vpr